MLLLGINLLYWICPEAAKPTPLGGLTLCAGVAPKKNPPTWAAGGRQGILVSRYGYRIIRELQR
jgi:hypothetical protein